MKDDATSRLTAILIAALAVLSALAPVRFNMSEPAPGETDVASRPPEGKLARPTPQQYAWHEQERIQFVCLDPCTWQERVTAA